LSYLKDKGFTSYEVIPDPTNPKYNWFLFENTPELENAVEEYFAGLGAKRLEAEKIG
jgi:predicted aspartyl protease